MAILIRRSNGSTLGTIADEENNATLCGLNLVGVGVKEYSRSFAENFVRLLENFANGSPPSRPIPGQIWYDTTVGKLKMFDGSTWISIVMESNTSEYTSGCIGVSLPGIGSITVMFANGLLIGTISHIKIAESLLTESITIYGSSYTFRSRFPRGIFPGLTLAFDPNDYNYVDDVNNAVQDTAKLPRNIDNSINTGPNNGRIGDLAFQDKTAVQIDGVAGYINTPETRKLKGADIRWLYTTVAIAEAEEAWGWAICDGRVRNGVTTPNLTGCFPMMYTLDELPGTFGGDNSITFSGGSHLHTGTVNGTALASTQIPIQLLPPRKIESGSDITIYQAEAGNSQPHNHTMNIQASTHTHTIPDSRPRFVSMVALMYVRG